MIGHIIADFLLQNDVMAKRKNRHRVVSSDEIPYGSGYRLRPYNCWFHYLSAHSLIHAGVVWYITGNVMFGYAEYISHLIIDFLKCEDCLSPHTDQALHVLCKIAYVAAFYYFI